VDDPESRVLELVLAISDGEPVDWEAAESRAGDETPRDLLAALREISDIARAHRTWQGSADGEGWQPKSPAVGSALPGKSSLLAPGSLIASRYRIEGEVGAGGFGRVYRALDVRLRRTVAVKALFVDDARELTAERAMRFLSEARTLARLEHRHIVPVYDAGVEADTPWLAMKLVEGRSLAATLAEHGPLAPQRAVKLLLQVAHALRHAHERGIVHRDVKPANVLIGRGEDGSESVWLTDFGVAKLLRGKADPQGVQLIGTPFYMAPEQITGRAVDARTDIFSFGCVAAELVTGARVWKGDSLSAVLESIVRSLPDLTVVRLQAGDAFVEIVRRCLAKSPEDRWQTVDELARALGGLTVAAPGSRREPAPRRPRLFPWGRRHEAVWDERSPLVVHGLRKEYRLRKPVLAGLDLEIPRGAVYALLGRNGSGKSTLIRTCLGIYRRDAGEVRVFGRDPERERKAVLARIGLVPDTLLADERFRVGELIRFVSGFYPRWDNACCHRLIGRYDLDLDQRLRDLSRGQRTQVSLVLALSVRPDLLLLDDPTLGLDALVMDEFFATLEEVRRDGTTILIASHNYEEVERLATHVGLLDRGSIVLSESFEVLRARAKQVQLTFAEVAPIRKLASRGMARSATTLSPAGALPPARGRGTIPPFRPPMRVLLVANTLPPRDVSGVGEQVLQLAAGLRAIGHEVEVLGRGPEGARGPKLLFPLFAVPAVRRALRRFRPHVVQVHESDGALAALAVAVAAPTLDPPPLLAALLQVSYVEERRAVRPLVAAGGGRHTGEVLGRPGAVERRFRWAKAPLQIALGRLTAAIADLVLAPSAATAAELTRDYGADRIAVVPNATGARWWEERSAGTADPAVPDSSARSGDLLFVGRLRLRKGVEVLLAALAELRGRGVAARLTIAGDGEHRAALESAAAALELGGAVDFLGRCDARRIAALLAGAGALVVPSIYEGMPLVVLEAMAAGVPVVASAVAGIPEVVVDGETGWLVPPEAPAALAGALAAVLTDPAEAARRGAAGRRRVEERYRPEAVARVWEAAVRSAGKLSGSGG